MVIKTVCLFQSLNIRCQQCRFMIYVMVSLNHANLYTKHNAREKDFFMFITQLISCFAFFFHWLSCRLGNFSLFLFHTSSIHHLFTSSFTKLFLIATVRSLPLLVGLSLKPLLSSCSNISLSSSCLFFPCACLFVCSLSYHLFFLPFFSLVWFLLLLPPSLDLFASPDHLSCH